MKVFLRIAALVSGVLAASLLAFAGRPPQTKPSFEVVSIKPSPPDITMRGGGPRGDRLVLSGASLKMLLNMAYRVSGDSSGSPMQIIGGPDWIESALYDVQAKADCSGGVVSREQLMLMVQAMLEDRFRLKAHVEKRDLPVYNMIVGKDGPRMKASADQTSLPAAMTSSQPCGQAPAAAAAAPPPPPLVPGKGLAISQMPRGAILMMMGPGSMTLQASAVPISQLASLLRQTLGRPVIDKTGIAGYFDVNLKFSPESLNLPQFAPAAPGLRGGPPPAAPGGAFAGVPPASDAEPVPSLFSAIQELGLKLEQARGPVEVVVVESVQKPSDN